VAVEAAGVAGVVAVPGKVAITPQQLTQDTLATTLPSRAKRVSK
jgi:hypothetical protein